MQPFLPICPRWFRLAIALLIGGAIAAVATRAQSEGEADPDEEPIAEPVEPAKQLVFVQELFGVAAGGVVPSLKSPYDVKVSPDGKHVYLALQEGDAVTWLERDAATGELTVRGSIDGTSVGQNALNGARSLAISPDGAYVYVASMFGGVLPSVGGSLITFRRDEATGELTHLGSVFDTDPGIDGLRGARSVAMSPDGKNLYVSAYDDGKLSVFSRNSATGAVSFLGVYEEGDQGVEELTDPHAVTVSPDGKSVYVGLWGNVVVAFDRSLSTGLLTYASKVSYLIPEHSDSSGSARALEVSPDGKFAYLASSNVDAITVFARDAATGALAVASNARNLGGGVKDMDGPYDIAISADGAYVYVAAFSSDAVVSFKRDAESGSIAYFQSILAEEDDDWVMNGPFCIAASPDGEHVYVGSASGSHSLTGFRREIIVDPPEFVVQPVATSIEEGGAAAFYALAQGIGVTYQWRKDDAPLTGQTLPVLTISPAVASFNGAAYTVVATNAGGSVESAVASLTVLPPIVVEPPADLTALDISSSSARLAWTDASDNETNFEVQRRLPGGEFAAIATVLANQTQHLDTSVQAATTYRYRVRAKRNEDVSLWSNEAVIESYADIPQAPVNLSLVEQSYNKVVLGWSDRSAVETGFRIQRRPDELDAEWVTIGLSEANANRYTDRSVTSDSTFAYRVQAYNESGSSDFSNAVVAITTAIPVNSISPLSREIPKDAASGYAISVTSTQSWEALPDVSWLLVTSPANGMGSGNQSVLYKSTANESQAERIGKILVGGIPHTVVQKGSPPFLRIQSSSAEVSSGGGTALVEVQSNVAWTASESASWFSITSGSAGSNYGTVVLSVDPNSSFDGRTATLTINDREHTVRQAGATKTLNLQSGETSFAASGGSGSVTVTSNIAWSASVSYSWIRLTGDVAGEGNGSIAFTVEENVGFDSRAADITVNEKAISVSQSPLVISDIEPPAFLAADVSSGLGVALSWSDNSADETGFILRRAPAGSETFEVVALLDANATSYFDRNAPRGAAWTYRIAALDTVGRSIESEIVTQLLPASNIVALVTRAELGGAAGLAYSSFSMGGEGKLTLTKTGLGPRLKPLFARPSNAAAVVQIGGSTGEPATVGVGVAVDWPSRFDFRALAFGAGDARNFDARQDGLIHGLETISGEKAFPRGVSALGYIAGGDTAIIGAFEVVGSISLPVLARAIGPGVARQKIDDFLADPRLELYRLDAVEGAPTLLFSNDDWEQWDEAGPVSLEDALTKAQALALEPGSSEAQMLTLLEPGRYACVLRGAGSAAGVASLQIHDVR